MTEISERKAWASAFLVGVLWGNAVGMIVVASNFWKGWDALTLYVVITLASFSIIAGVAAGVAAFLYQEG